MKSLTLLTLGLLSAAFLTGCATQKTSNGRITNVGAGLVKVQTGSYQPAKPTTIDFNLNEAIGNSADSAGTETTILWGLFTLNGY
ncbi:MAG: hypothetical protein ABII82_02045 [Verrucomicrobiota bacterium]